MTEQKSGYRQSITEIETILAKIENGETDIDTLAAEIKHATNLLKQCKEKLLLAEQDVKKTIDLFEN